MQMNMKRFVALLLAASCFSLPAGSVPATAAKPLSFTVTLMENTPMYGSPDDTLQPSGAIAPQNVRIVEAEDSWLDYRHPSEAKWFKAETWLGGQWIRLELRKAGAVSPVDMNMWLQSETPLFDTPYADAATGLALSPQRVRVTAEYRSKFHMAYLVDTWAGAKWVVGLEHPIAPVTDIRETWSLPAGVALFDAPIPDAGSITMELGAQTVTALQQYKGDWYRIVTSDGREGWINRKYAQPQGASAADESIHVTVTTPLMKYPVAPELRLGSIAPQQVRAFEKWTSPEGEAWFRIHSYAGDAWIRPLTHQGPYLSEEAALKLGKAMDPEGTAVWSAEFIAEFLAEESREIRPVWAVRAVYPAGNQMVVWIDAVTGKQLGLAEIEGGGWFPLTLL